MKRAEPRSNWPWRAGKSFTTSATPRRSARGTASAAGCYGKKDDAMPAVTLDHCVIHVSDWERSNAFYITVMGAELIARPVGYAYRFGDRQLNVHGPGVEAAELARLPVAPGNSDLCFEWRGPIADAMTHLE